jgi:hypothetical protein
VIQFAPIFFLIFFIFALAVWQALIIIQGISEIHQIEFAESLISFLFPALLVGIISFFTIVLMIISLINFISLI